MSLKVIIYRLFRLNRKNNEKIYVQRFRFFPILFFGSDSNWGMIATLREFIDAFNVMLHVSVHFQPILHI